MALKFVIDTLEEIDAALRPHYVAEAGKFHLATQGDHPKVTEFRETNIALLKKFEGVDPDALKTKVTSLEAQLQAAPQRVAELEAALATEKATTAASVLRGAVTGAFLAAGGRPEAADFMTSAAEKVFAVKNGEILTEAFSPTAPGQKLTITSWLEGQLQSAGFAFKPSSGGGAPPSRGGEGSSKKTLRNPTPQELGQHANAIRSGEIKVEFTT